MDLSKRAKENAAYKSRELLKDAEEFTSRHDVSRRIELKRIADIFDAIGKGEPILLNALLENLS